MNEILKEDVKNNVTSIELLKDFEEKKILVTGATGLIGSVLVMTLLQYAKDNDADITVYALIRDEKKAERIFQDYLNEDKLIFIKGDITEKLTIDGRIDFIIHLASITSSKAFVNRPVEVIKSSVNGAINILEFAKEKNVNGLLYASSLEIYGVPDNNEEITYYSEEKAGFLNPLEVRSSYSEGKKMIENLCVSYCSEYGVPAKIARLTQTFGPGIDYMDNRVFAEFVRLSLEGKDIVIHSTGETTRPYCYTCDAISAIIYILLKGKEGKAYNVANEETLVSIKELADKIAGLSDSSIRVIVKNDMNKSMGYNPDFKISLITDKLKELGWESRYSLDIMLRRLMAYMEGVKG